MEGRIRCPRWQPRSRDGVRAAVSPALVRSRINSRSNSASAAKMPNTRRPAAVVVSIYAPCPVSTSRPTPLGDRSCTVGVDQVGAGAAEAIELPVQSARTQLSNPGWSSRAPDAQSWQTWTAATPSTCSASRCRSSDWEAVRLRDASVADQHVS